MTIGFSLPLDYLAGTGESDESTCWGATFGKPADCLSELKSRGVGSIEIQKFGSHAPADHLLAAARVIIRSGMQVTAHGYLPQRLEGSLFVDAYPPFRSMLDFLRDCQKETIIVVHAHADSRTPASDLVESTSRALAGIADRLREAALPVRIALEINRWHGVDTPGATYAGLLAMTRDLRGTETGFCWDMGHTRSSVLHNKLDAEPPPGFVGQVIHAHVHGLSTDGDTHHPVTDSSRHLAGDIGRLTASGYRGVYNLELYPARWKTDRAVRNAVLDSVVCLAAILNAARNH